MFGWRRRSEGFEWKEYVRTTVLVRRATANAGLEDARLRRSRESKMLPMPEWTPARGCLGREDRTLARAGVYRTGNSRCGGRRLLGFVRWISFAWNVVKDAAGALWEPVRGALRVPADAARDKLKMMPDVARKFPIKAHHLISAALVLGLIYVGGPMLRSADGISAPGLDISAAARVSAGSSDTSRQVTISNEISGPRRR